MAILNKINDSIKTAMKAKDAVTLRALKQIKTFLVKYQKDNSIAEPTDEQLISQLEKYIAERKKTIATLNEANGNSYDLGDKIADEETEMKLAISFYLKNYKLFIMLLH
jgi:uncharacterized protein YqeY